MTELERELGQYNALEAAYRLVGCDLVREVNKELVIGRIVETEAYDQSDPASHTFKGATPRNQVMFGPAGRAYVYFTYGLHYCMNVVVDEKGHGSAVLIRALEPIQGQQLMIANRNTQMMTNLTNGPAKLTQAMLIDRQYNGHDLNQSPLKLILRDRLASSQLIATERIGIKEGRQLRWRICVRNSPYLSRKPSIDNLTNLT